MATRLCLPIHNIIEKEIRFAERSDYDIGSDSNHEDNNNFDIGVANHAGIAGM